MVTHNLLLVDDEANVLAGLKRILRKEGYRILTATSGKDGLDILENETVPIVISDQKMPEMDGTEFLSAVKAKHPHIMRIMLTGQTDIGVAMEAINRGEIFKFITKPCDNVDLKTTIKQALKQYELVNDNIELHKLTSRQNEELKGLNENLEKMVRDRTQTIEAQKEELITFNRGLEQKVKEKTEELREKDMQLLKMDRIAGISTLAAGIAHEINNPLSFIKGSIGPMKKALDKVSNAVKFWDNQPVPEQIMKDYKDFLEQINFEHFVGSLDRKFERMNTGIERIMKIVNSLRSFSRVDAADMAELDIHSSIQEAVDILSAKLEKKVIFENEFQEIPHIGCSANEINQCFLHTIRNAIDAVDENGVIRIKTFHQKEEDQIIIKIADNGKGISSEIIDQVFNPFFTTKPVGSGTGVGLSITETIIKSHGGNIDLVSNEGEGTEITMVLPVVGKMK